MFKWRKQVRRDEEPDIYRIVPKARIENRSRVGARDDGILNQVQDDGEIVKRFSIDLEERMKCNMGQAKEDATMLEKLINNKL